jgi:transposase-like protein
MNQIKYFEFAFEQCPYCESKNINVNNITCLGAHFYAMPICRDCKEVWKTSNVMQINWKIPDNLLKLYEHYVIKRQKVTK